MRRGSELNRRPRLCRPLHNHSATPPPTLARLHPTSAPRRTANQGWRGPPRANGVGCRAAGTCTASRATKLKTGDRSYRLDLPGNLERETRLELATPTLARLCSTTELFPRKNGHRIIGIRHLVSRRGGSLLPAQHERHGHLQVVGHRPQRERSRDVDQQRAKLLGVDTE